MARDSLAPQLAKAADAGIIEAEGDVIRFTHPIYGSAIYADASREHRHRVHRRLSEVIVDEEERARHLAVAADGPDEAAVAALERAAIGARARGSPAAAAELCELAERLLPPGRDDDLLRLRMAAADLRSLAGDQEGAVALLDPIASSVPSGSARAQILLRLGRVRSAGGDQASASATFSEALRHEALDPALASALHTWRSAGGRLAR